jgi:hypothetical protein
MRALWVPAAAMFLSNAAAVLSGCREFSVFLYAAFQKNLAAHGENRQFGVQLETGDG